MWLNYFLPESADKIKKNTVNQKHDGTYSNNLMKSVSRCLAHWRALWAAQRQSDYTPFPVHQMDSVKRVKRLRQVLVLFKVCHHLYVKHQRQLWPCCLQGTRVTAAITDHVRTRNTELTQTEPLSKWGRTLELNVKVTGLMSTWRSLTGSDALIGREGLVVELQQAELKPPSSDWSSTENKIKLGQIFSFPIDLESVFKLWTQMCLFTYY